MVETRCRTKQRENAQRRLRGRGGMARVEIYPPDLLHVHETMFENSDYVPYLFHRRDGSGAFVQNPTNARAGTHARTRYPRRLSCAGPTYRR